MRLAAPPAAGARSPPCVAGMAKMAVCEGRRSLYARGGIEMLPLADKRQASCSAKSASIVRAEALP